MYFCSYFIFCRPDSAFQSQGKKNIFSKMFSALFQFFFAVLYTSPIICNVGTYICGI